MEGERASDCKTALCELRLESLLGGTDELATVDDDCASREEPGGIIAVRSVRRPFSRSFGVGLLRATIRSIYFLRELESTARALRADIDKGTCRFNSSGSLDSPGAGTRCVTQH